MELLNIFGLAVAETVETSEAGKYRLPHCHHCTGRNLQNLVQISFIKKTQQILHISGKVESTLKADHILEMSRLSKIKDDLQFVLLKSCFVGHPVHQILICGSK